MKSNTIYIYNKVWHTALSLLCVSLLFSCVKVDLCTAEEHPHTGNLKIVYHWPENVGGERPDSMLALVNRIVNTRRVGYVTDAKSSVGGRYRFGKVYRNEDTIAANGHDKYPLLVGAGEYQVFAFNNDVVDINKGGVGINAVADYKFDNLAEYSDGQHVGEVGIRDLSISYIGRERTDPDLYLYGKDWVDFNDYDTKYIATEVTPIYRAINKHNEETQEYTVSIRANEKAVVDLYPQKITQDITFSFPIYTDAQASVDSIIAEISGIPYKMMLYTGVLNVDSTYKMLFQMGMDKENAKEVTLDVEEIVGEDTVVVSKNFMQFECMSTISVMGLIANSDTTDFIGPGILQLCIYVSDKTNPAKTKTKYAKIKLYNTINNANLLIRDEFGHIVQNPGTYEELPLTDTLRIDDSRLMVTRDLILQTSDDDNTVDSWVESGSGEDGDNRLEIEW